MFTVGIHDGHTATACAVEDGVVRACVSEERLNREKEWQGFPSAATRKVLELAGKSRDQVDGVGICSLLPQIGHQGYLRPSLAKRLFGIGARVVPGSLLRREGNVALAQTVGRWMSRGRRREIAAALESLGLGAAPATYYEHHHLHAATAHYLNWNRCDPSLVLTLDGSGDAVCGSVQIGREGRLERVASLFNYTSICELYTRVTQTLGMKPMSHEYKVMGMAPYADEARSAALASSLRELYRLSPSNPLQIENRSGRWKWQFQGLFDKLLRGQRFDIVSGALQSVFEEIVLAWVRSAIERTGIRDLALSGGGFMNVKLNGKILELPEVESLFVFPSCGDESNAVGAAVLAALDRGFDPRRIAPLGMVDWGPEFDDSEVEEALARLPQEGFVVSRHDDIDVVVGRKVAEGQIIGRMAGRMEWGARSLGNRSILADPSSQKVIHRINKAIKMRDFWMPFAPAVLQEYRDRYLKLRADYHCPFMTMACETTEEAYRDITAGLHPFDRTARPQVVDPDNHPRFYRVIRSFCEATGVGGVLNTSFNLLESDLDAIQMESFLVERRRV